MEARMGGKGRKAWYEKEDDARKNVFKQIGRGGGACVRPGT
jgi:hypothetical protein